MREITLSKAVNEAIAEEMRRDPSVFLLGEDVAEAGTPFKVLAGLVDEFGTSRVIDTPISEPGFTGIAVALMGRNHPMGFVLASLLFGFLTQGGSELQFEYSIDARIVVVLQGLVILFSGALQNMMKHPIERLYLTLANRSGSDQAAAEA